MTTIMIMVALVLYFLPTWVAQGKPQYGRVVIVNLLLGWTLVGWVIALVWAMGPGRNAQMEEQNRLLREVLEKDKQK